MSSLAFPDSLPAARTRTLAAAVPWYVWTALFGVFCGVAGAHWDISWHRSIGRDTFWTPAHLMIQAKGVLAGITFGYLILSTTFAHRDAEDVVSIWGLKGPLGAFIAAWGGVMMITSAPFDNWWHDAYGLDVRIISPPHIILLFGSHAVTFGTLVLVQALRARGTDEQRRALMLPLLLLGGFVLIELMVLKMEYTHEVLQHSGQFYRTMAIGVPAVLCIFSRVSGHRWACTIVAALYTAFLWGLTLFLPLFPAEPKLGPVYMHITHFIPNGFPLLFIVPAIAMDLVMRKIGNWNRWLIALVMGPLYFVTFLAAQWPMANFMLSPASRNAIFGANYFAYFTRPTSYSATYRFFTVEPTAAAFWTTMAFGLLIAAISARVGLGIGQWLLRIKR